MDQFQSGGCIEMNQCSVLPWWVEGMNNVPLVAVMMVKGAVLLCWLEERCCNGHFDIGNRFQEVMSNVT